MTKPAELVEHGPNVEIENSFMAGLLHDVGKLVLVDALPENTTRQWQSLKRQVCRCRKQNMTCSVRRVQRWVPTYFGFWGLPDPIVEAVAYHHSPSRCPVANEALGVIRPILTHDS
jgi:HD-like signal output (HDOD) protein